MLQNKEGQRVPDVTFRTRQGHDWVNVTSQDIFAGKTVVVFSLPGAFTPTCSSSHVPRYNQLAREFSRHGVDEIVCVSVNDAFVMNEWQDDQKAWNIRFLPDGTGEFTAGMGMLVGARTSASTALVALLHAGRGWRRAEDVHRERGARRSHAVSDADTMLAYLAPARPSRSMQRFSRARAVRIAREPRPHSTRPTSPTRSWC